MNNGIHATRANLFAVASAALAGIDGVMLHIDHSQEFWETSNPLWRITVNIDIVAWEQAEVAIFRLMAMVTKNEWDVCGLYQAWRPTETTRFTWTVLFREKVDG